MLQYDWNSQMKCRKPFDALALAKGTIIVTVDLSDIDQSSHLLGKLNPGWGTQQGCA